MPSYYLTVLLFLLWANVIAAEQIVTNQYKAGAPAGVINYYGLNENVATSGSLAELGLVEIQNLGFKTIIDLRSETELAMDNEADRVQQLGLRYFSLPVAKDWPSAGLLKQFSELINNADNHPVLVHCRSGNRVGFIWGLHQLAMGVDAQTAVTEAKAIGLTGSRLQALQHYIGNGGNNDGNTGE